MTTRERADAAHAADVDAFLQFSTATISDALDELGVRGVLYGLSALLPAPGRIAGHALTVKFTRKTADAAAYRFGGGVGKPLEQVLQTMAAGQVIVFDLEGTREASPWGGLASRLARDRGVRGVVVWGCSRDVDEIRDLDFPVWSVGTCPRRSRNEFTFGSIGEPIEVTGVRVARDDIVIADASGVVVVARARAAQVLDLAGRIAASEREMTRQIDARAVVDWDKV